MIKKPNKLIQYVSIALGAVLACGVFMSSTNFSLSNVLRSRASETASGSIVFSNSSSSPTGETTRTTTAFTSITGSPIICKVIGNNPTYAGNKLGAVTQNSEIRFYESDGVTEYTFEGVNRVIITKGSSYFKFNIHYYITDGEEKLYESKENTTAVRNISFAGFGDLANLWIEVTNDVITQISSIELQYNCTEKYQTGLTVTTNPTKTTYSSGEKFDPTGMVVKAQYSSGQSLATSKYTYSPTRDLTTDDTEVSIYFGGFVATVPITVEEAAPFFTGKFYSTNASYSSTYFDFETGEYYESSSGVSVYFSINSSNTLTLISGKPSNQYSGWWLFSSDTGGTTNNTISSIDVENLSFKIKLYNTWGTATTREFKKN